MIDLRFKLDFFLHYWLIEKMAEEYKGRLMFPARRDAGNG
jgi:hypothetical protein